MKKIMSIAVVIACLSVISYAGADTDTQNTFKVKGQKVTCAGPKNKIFKIEMKEVVVELGNGLRSEMWTFNGTVPGPTIEACAGDTVTLHVTNMRDIAHGLDTHAFTISAKKFGPIDPGKTIIVEGVVNTPGVFMYHCAAGPVTDQHIKMNMSGIMIVYDRSFVYRDAKEFAVLRGALFGNVDDHGMINADSKMMEMNQPLFYMFNGKIDHAPLSVKGGDLVRIYFVNAAPGVASFHVIGTILEKSYAGGNPKNIVYDVQTFEVGNGNGAMIEFKIPEEGLFVLVDHDQLTHLSNGFLIPFIAQ